MIRVVVMIDSIIKEEGLATSSSNTPSALRHRSTTRRDTVTPYTDLWLRPQSTRIYMRMSARMCDCYVW